MASQQPDQLVIFHYHLRPGGVRRVIDRALPAILRAAPGKLERVILATGEAAPNRGWLEELEKNCWPVAIEERVESALGYVSELSIPPGHIRTKTRNFFRHLLEHDCGPNTVVWAHNLGLARNVMVAEELAGFCQKLKIPLLSHHHDLWFDNRWHRWPEAVKSGYRTEKELAAALFPINPNTIHATINRRDHKGFARHLKTRAVWLPNHCDLPSPTSKKNLREARRWMTSVAGKKIKRFWVIPCRLLRRKNVAEAFLLQRWFDPEAAVLITGAPSSAEEESYAWMLKRAAAQHGWNLHLQALEGLGVSGPAIDHVIAAADVIALTSLQEGFGLAFLEAAAHGRPIVCRELPNVAPDLKYFGFEFPHRYREVKVSRTLFDLSSEIRRQKHLWQEWRNSLPTPFQGMAETTELLAETGGFSVSFSRLSLNAQLQVLSLDPTTSRKASKKFNRFLESRMANSRGTFAGKATRWPGSATTLLGSAQYGESFWNAIRMTQKPTPAVTPVEIQNSMVEGRLRKENIYPLLLTSGDELP